MNEYHLPGRDICYHKNEFVAGRETLVFIHGLSGSLSAWDLYEKRFESEYNVLTYDIRGHGKSYKPHRYDDYAISHFSEDLEFLLSHLGIESCVLISHSFGTLVAFQYLHEHPQRVSRAVLLSADAAPYADTLARLVYPFILIAKAVTALLPFPKHKGWHVDYTKYPDTTDWDIPVMWANIRNSTLQVYMYCTLQSYNVDARPYLKDIRIPVLLMHGTRDTIFPVSNAYFLHKEIADSKLIVMPDIDHILVLNRPHEVSEAIEAFVQDTK